KRDTPESAAEAVLQLEEGTRFYVLFPAAAGMEEQTASSNGVGKQKKRGAKSNPSQRTRIDAHLMSLMQRGFTRLYKNGRMIELATPDSYADNDFDNTFVLVDRLVVTPDTRTRLVDSLEVCYQEGHGQAIIDTANDPAVR